MSRLTLVPNPQRHPHDPESPQRAIGVTAESIAAARAAMWQERFEVMAQTNVVFDEEGNVYLSVPTPIELQRANALEAIRQGIAIGNLIGSLLN